MRARGSSEFLRKPMEIFRVTRRHEGPLTAGAPDPSYEAFELLYLCFIATPIIAGLDKLLDGPTNWGQYLAPALADWLGQGLRPFLDGIGALELALGLLVAFQPRRGGLAATGWLWVGAANVLASQRHYGVFACLAALSLAARAFARLAEEYG